MSSSNNTTEFCNITQSSHEKWREAYMNSTFKPQFEEAGNTTSTPIHQQCQADGKYSGPGAVHCPSTIFPTCQLMATKKNDTSYPFSTNNNTTEECQCTGYFPNSTSTSTTVNCTCMNDWRANNTTFALNHTMPYLLTKNCTAELLQNDTRFNLNCTLLNCRYSVQAQALNITLNPSESCNDTSPVILKPNITDVTTLTTTRPATSPVANTSTVSTSTASTSKATTSTLSKSSTISSSTAPAKNSTTTKVTPSSSTTSVKTSVTPSPSISSRSSVPSVSNSSSAGNSSSIASSNSSSVHNQTTSLTSVPTSSRTSSSASTTTSSQYTPTASQSRSSFVPESSSSISSRSMIPSSPNTIHLSSSKMEETTNTSTFLSSRSVSTTNSVMPLAQASSRGYASSLNNDQLVANPVVAFVFLLFHLFVYSRIFQKEFLNMKKKNKQ